MESYVVLLRGINVGKNHLLAMSDLKKLLESLNFTQVTTYIRSGNAVMVGKNIDSAALAKEIQLKLSQLAGFLIPIVIYTGSEFKEIVEKNLSIASRLRDDQQLILAYQQEEIVDIEALTLSNDVESGWIVKKAVCMQITGPQLESKLLKDYQKLFKQNDWTLRNWKTSLKLVELVKALDTR